mmetsp:Transcript_26223/g.73525  ORF Transcript_26223/g.73525 Transcript_26223/m.73525 type:complete len:80 (-) Transcript_26223:297-536(-)
MEREEEAGHTAAAMLQAAIDSLCVRQSVPGSSRRRRWSRPSVSTPRLYSALFPSVPFNWYQVEALVPQRVRGGAAAESV